MMLPRKGLNIAKYLPIILFGFALLRIAEYYTGRQVIGPDQSVQYAVAKQLYYGHGYVKPIGVADSTGMYLDYQNVSSFPPGFSLLVAPLFAITRDVEIINWIIVALNLAAFTSLLMVFIRRVYGKEKTLLYSSLVVAYLAVYSGSFLFLGHTSDLLCVNIIGLSLILLWKYFEARTRKSTILLLIGVAMLPLTFYFRYAYFVSLFIYPLYFMIRLAFSNNENRIKEFWLVTVASLVTVLPVIYHVYHINVIGATSHVVTTSAVSSGWGLHVENIVYMSPFPMNVLADQFPVIKVLGYKSLYGYDRGYIYPFWVQILFYLVSIVVVYFVIEEITSKRYSKSVSDRAVISFGLLLSMMLVLFLINISLVTPSKRDEYVWSWAMINRYYLFPCIYMMFALVMSIFSPIKTLKRNVLRAIVAVCFLYNLSLTVYNYTRNYQPFDFALNTRVLDGEGAILATTYLVRDLHKIESSTPNLIVVVDSLMTSTYFADHFMAMANAVIVPESAMNSDWDTMGFESAVYVSADSTVLTPVGEQIRWSTSKSGFFVAKYQ